MKSNPAKLEAITKQIRDLIEEVSTKSLRIADLVRQAKETFFQESCLAWLEWTENSFGFSRRHSFTLLRVSELVRCTALNGIDLVAACGQWTDKLETIAQIPFDRIPEFLAICNPKAMDREELRDAVRKFLNKPARSDRQTDFLKIIGQLPDPEVLYQAVKDPKFIAGLDPVRVSRFADTGHALMGMAMRRHFVDGDYESIDQIRAVLLNDISALDKFLAKRK